MNCVLSGELTHPLQQSLTHTLIKYPLEISFQSILNQG